MSFKLNLHKSVADELRRLTLEQTQKAIDELHSKKLSEEKKVHQVRKRCKKIRGLTRLFVETDEQLAKNENKFFRNTARLVSGARDSKVVVDAFDSLALPFDLKTAEAMHSCLNDGLKPEAEKSDGMSALLRKVETNFEKAKERIKQWRFDKDEADLVLAGFEATYTDAFDQLDEVRKESSTEQLHEWRKSVKYHGFHCEVLHSVWPAYFAMRSQELKLLGDLLGKDHDLAVLSDSLAQHCDVLVKKQLRSTLRLIECHRDLLSFRFMPIGKKLFATSPRDFVDSVKSCWKIASSKL